jgi:uncharacterized membrane protein
MMFLSLLVLGSLLAAVAMRIGLIADSGWHGRMRLGLVLGLLLVGSDHLLTPERYVAMIEGLLPAPEFLVAFTGLCEIAGAIGLLIPATRRVAGAALAVYFVAVFPANVANAFSGLSVEGLPSAGWYYWVRLGFQPIFVWWALIAGGLNGGLSRGTSPLSTGGAAGSHASTLRSLIGM